MVVDQRLKGVVSDSEKRNGFKTELQLHKVVLDKGDDKNYTNCQIGIDLPH